jgi:hypothetical protein
MPIVELDLEGMNIDSVKWGGSVLRANFGDGYGDAAVVGLASGLHTWALSSGCLPDDEVWGTIEGVSRFAYYWDFFKSHTTGETEIFIIEWRGGKYHASFVDTEMSAEVFTADLFSGGVQVKQRRITGSGYNADGSIDEDPPSTPTDLEVTSTTSSSITIDWTASTD